MVVACIALVDDVVEFAQVQFGQLSPDQVANNDPIQVDCRAAAIRPGNRDRNCFSEVDLPGLQEYQGIRRGRFAVLAGLGGGLLFHSDPELDSPGAGDERNLASQRRSQKLAAKTRFMADCRAGGPCFCSTPGSRRSRWKSRSRPRPTTNGRSPRCLAILGDLFSIPLSITRSGLLRRFIDGKRPSSRASIQATSLHPSLIVSDVFEGREISAQTMPSVLRLNLD